MPSGNANNPQNLGPKVGALTHPLYLLMKPTWEKLIHVREGTGGFLSIGNDSYLVAHPREYLDHTTIQTDPITGAQVARTNPNPRNPSPKLIARRKLARYENIAGSLLESKKAVLFREQPTRRVGEMPVPVNNAPIAPANPLQPPPPPKPAPPPVQPDKTDLERWWDNVDGNNTHIDDAMPQWWDLAATLGHVVLYFDVAGDPDAETAADQAQPFVRVYTPLDVLDWRRDATGEMVWIKLLEAIQSPVTDMDVKSITTYRVRIVDETSWTLYDYKTGAYIDQGDHQLGVLPVVYLFGKRRALLTDIGDSILGDPRNYIDLFNLTSELRELLRSQTFSFINLPLGTGPDATTVEAAQAMMGQQTGAMNVFFSAQPAQILAGEPANVSAYQEEIARVKRDIFREMGVHYESDTKAAEAQGTLELKREEMATRVAAYADECEQAEYGLVCLWYRAKYGAEQGDQKMDDDHVQIHYPEHFQQTPFKDVLDEAAAAQSLGMPGIFMRELRKSLISKFNGMANLDADTLAAIVSAIDAMPDDPTPADKMQQRMQLAVMASKNGGRPMGGGAADGGDPTQAAA